MKFGNKLRADTFTPWRLSYIQYDVLKTELKTRQQDHGWTEEDEHVFVQLLENELEKVYGFVQVKMAEINARISYCEKTIQAIMSNTGASTSISWEVLDEAVTEMLFDVNDLVRFSRINYNGFQKILKKHDKWTHLNLQQDFVPKLRSCPLDTQRFDVPIVFISGLHDICRRRGQPQAGESTAGGNQLAFERATAKYWIHPDNVTEVKSIIALNLPVLVFNSDKVYEAEDSAISSVYFDNPDFELYTGRLQRDEAAEAIRFRWYGPNAQGPIFIERKTHHAPWLDGVSIKDRFKLDYPDVKRMLDGSLTEEQFIEKLKAEGKSDKDIEAAAFIFNGVRTSFQNKRLVPVCRIFYNRTAFQKPGDQRVRVSLDTDLTFIREDNFDGMERRGPGEWRRSDVGINYPFSDLAPGDVQRFPYAVLETKLQTHLGQEQPEWLRQLVKSHLVHEVPRFSKYLHAASSFFDNRIPLVPWWLSELNVDIQMDRKDNFGLTRSESFRPIVDCLYRTAMDTEERRINETIASGSQHFVSTERIPPGHRQSLGAKTLVDSDGQLIPPPQTNGRLAPYACTNPSTVFSDESSYYPQKAGETILQLGDAPHDYGQLPPREGSIHSDNLGKPVVIKKKKLVIDDNINEKDDPNAGQMPLQLWERMLFGKIPTKTPRLKRLDANGERIAFKGLKVEPKVFFANERTFISWLQFCALLLTVALSLLNFGDSVSRIAGGIFIGISAVVAIYALYRFEKRAWMINRRIMGSYDDIWGPCVLCVLLVGALIVNFYLRFK